MNKELLKRMKNLNRTQYYEFIRNSLGIMAFLHVLPGEIKGKSENLTKDDLDNTNHPLFHQAAFQFPHVLWLHLGEERRVLAQRIHDDHD